MNQKRIAIFVEGQTERIFVTKLLQEIAGYKKISIEIWKAEGSRNNRKIAPLKSDIVKTSSFFVLLHDCGSESHVISDIKKQYLNLSNKNYEKILGIRDLFPKSLSDKVVLEKSIKGDLKRYLKVLKESPAKIINTLDINIILAIMEVEAWFLAEFNVFFEINNLLNTDFILQRCGIDLINIDVEQRPHPSRDLDNIYHLIGCDYTKNHEQVKDIVEHLDYEFIYLNLRYKVKQLGELIREIDDFLV
jgi:hypothetical protein